MDFGDELDLVWTQYSERLAKIQRDIRDMIRDALAMLEKDIEDPMLTAPGSLPDAFMLRANQIGLALYENNLAPLADELYYQLTRATIEYRERTGNWRHAGAMLANNAAARSVQGDIDEAIVLLLRAAQDDVESYKIAQQDSYAITGLLKVHFTDLATNTALKFAQNVDPTLAVSDVESLCTFLGDRRYAFLAYALSGARHVLWCQGMPNEYSRLQAFSALRSLSSLFEVELKLVSGHMEEEFFAAIRRLYDLAHKPWWNSFDAARIAVGATRNSKVTADDRLRDALAIVPTDAESTFWKSLLVSYLVRNYTIHQLETNCALTTTFPRDALEHLLSAMLSARAFA